MASVQSVKRNVLFSWLAHAVMLGIGFFLMPYVVSVLGEGQYGAWVFINSFAAYANLLYFGFGETIARYVAKFHSEGDTHRVNQIVTLVMAIYVSMATLALAVAGLLAFGAPWLSRWEAADITEVRLVILILGLNVFVGMTGSVFGGVLLGLQRFDVERTASLVCDFIRLALILFFLRHEWGLLTIAVVFLTVTVIENLWFAVMAYRILPTLRIRWSYLDRGLLKECSAFSTMAFVNAIAAQLIYATDTIVIGLMLGTEAILPYYIGLRLTQFIRQPIDKIAHICMPTAGALQAEHDRYRRQRFLVKAVGVTALLSTGMFIGAWFFGQNVITAWMGESYPISHRILLILLAAQMVALPVGILRAFLFGQGTVRFPAFVYLAEAGFNLALSATLCHYYGIEGVAWGTAIPLFVMELGILTPYALWKLDLPFKRLVGDALWPQFLPLTALGLYAWIVSSQNLPLSSWPLLLAISAVGGLILAGLWHLIDRSRQNTAAA